LKERCIYENLDKLRSGDGGKLWHGSVWIPKYDADRAKATLDNMLYSRDVKSTEKAILKEKNWREMANPPKPPTHFCTNDFTAPFQEIVDTYGSPAYREVNPALWTTISFPYQFGVMFGDIGHGGLLFLVGIFLVVFNDKLRYQNSKLDLALNYRYLFFLMGGFAFYCGITYNDFFAVPLRLFGSCYDDDFERKDESCTVAMGVDPIWYQTKDEVAFINSLKMKLSIVICFIHMIMRLFNNIHFNDYLSLIFEFVPYIIFFMCTFGYMVVCIFIKWSTNWDGLNPPPIINIYTAAGSAWEGFVLWGDDQGVEQTNFQHTMFMVALAVVPLMLFPKPILNHTICRKKIPAHAPRTDDELGDALLGEEDKPEEVVHEEHGFAEDMIHQMIETIEFVLGAISNTASYLR
jgi:V-type H+-transporting ATPase subunit a